MAKRLSPRNSEVNALEQRGYLIGKKIGQVVYHFHLFFIPFNISHCLLSASSSVFTVASAFFNLYNAKYRKISFLFVSLLISDSFQPSFNQSLDYFLNLYLFIGSMRAIDQVKRFFVLLYCTKLRGGNIHFLN